jgi:septal ring factor EnvC (AmiA/AmiB activator)
LRAPSLNNPRKRAYSPDSYDSGSQIFVRRSSSPAPAHSLPSPSVRISSQYRDTTVDKYIVLQTEEEDLDRQLDETETERSDIAAKLSGIKNQLQAVEEMMSTLMEEKERIRAEKKGLQSSLGMDERFEVGFEAGRKMEAKRLKRL